MRHSKTEIEEIICKILYKNSTSDLLNELSLKEDMFYATAEGIAMQICDDFEDDHTDDHFEDIRI